MKVSLLTVIPFTALSAASAIPNTKRQAQTVSVSYDTKYDVPSSSLNTVSCSDGVNGLETQGYTTFNSLPNFPNIGGVPAVSGWNSPNCGKCYQLSYSAGKVQGSVYITAIDSAPNGFNIGLNAMDALTGGMAQELGRVQATYEEADPSKCGF